MRNAKGGARELKGRERTDNRKNVQILAYAHAHIPKQYRDFFHNLLVTKPSFFSETKAHLFIMATKKLIKRHFVKLWVLKGLKVSQICDSCS